MKRQTIIEIYDHVLATGERFPLYTWQHKNAKQDLQKLLRYLILDKLQLTQEQFLETYSLDFLQTHRLASAYRHIYRSNICGLAQEAFPEWTLHFWRFTKISAPLGYWNEENTIHATKWLIEEQLQWSYERVRDEISDAPFHANRLGGMLRVMRMGGAKAVMMAYPDRDWTYLKERRGYKVTSAQAQEVRRLYKEGVIQSVISDMMGIDRPMINAIVHNKAHKEK